eukprot:358660-Chlamydomonas_euryale.AAC.1
MRLSRLPSASAPGDAALEASQCFSALRCGSRGFPVLQRPAMQLSRLPSASAPGDAALEASQCFSAWPCDSRGFPVLQRPAMRLGARTRPAAASAAG